MPVMVIPSPRRHEVAARAAWACSACGYILAGEPTEVCGECGASPVRFITAPLLKEAADAAAPAVGEVDAERLSCERTNSAAGLFATSPAGAEGYDVNPELRVRY